MKHFKITQSIGLMIGLSSLLPAAQITWETSVDMYQGAVTDSFVNNNSQSLIAVNPSTGAVGDITLNGVVFLEANLAEINAGVTANGVTFSSNAFELNGPGTFATGALAGDANIGNMITGALWNVQTITFSGLTVGAEYSIQVFGNDARNGRHSNYVTVFSDGTQSVDDSMVALTAGFNQLDNRDPTNAAVGHASGDSVTGTFIADATSQSFDIAGSNNGGTSLNSGGRAQINGIQLRLILPDEDGDGISNEYEDANGLNRSDPSDAALDPDVDGLTNLREFQLGTDLNDNDSDDDNLLDGEEVDTYGTNPLLADTDGDTLNDDVEVLTYSTNPLVADSDVDGLTDADEVNVHQTNPNLADSDADGVNDPTELFISLTDPNLDSSVPTLDPNAVDLLAYWDFNNASNASQTIDLVNGYVGELNAGTTYTADALGHTEAAGDLAIYLGATANAGTGVTVELGEFLNLAAINDQFSISFWQKLDAGEPTGATSSVGASRYGVDRAIMAHLPFTDGNVYFDHGGGTANRVAGTPVFAVDWQQWNHITLVKNQDTKEVWINGRMALSGENAGAAFANNHHTVLLGLDDVGRNVVGHVDDFAFYADPLNSTQILALANGADPQNLDAVLADTDSDGMPDSYETTYGLDPNVNDAGLDGDNDMLTNLEEFNLGTLPNDEDTDDDGYLDGVETNTGVWVSATDTGTSPFLADTDGDGLLDGVENPDLPYVDANQTGTNPLIADTDGDTYTDGEEIAFGSDPLNPASLAADDPEIVLYYDFNGDSLSRVEGAPDSALMGGAVLSADSGGFSGETGDQSLDLGTVASVGNHAAVTAGDHFLTIEANNTVAISWWQKRTGPTVSSAAFAAPNFGGGRGLQSHAPWNNNLFYVDLMGFRRTVADPTIPDQWQHFVIQQYADGTVELWIDGVRAAEWAQGAADQQFALPGDVFIGATLGGANNMTGQLDDFAIFSGPLPGPHIQTLASGVSVGEFLNLGPQPLVITNIERVGDDITLTWNSRASEQFSLFYSVDMIDWEGEIDDGIAADPGATTSRTFNLGDLGLQGVEKLFFRVER
ncbi:MAG: LamG-like jellyroll fold domain-containing protein [Verrucomicrobiaceae bacterium]